MVERRSECEAPACSSDSERDESPDRVDSRCRSESGSPDRLNGTHGSASDSPDRLNQTNEGSQDNASNLAAPMTGQPRRPASDSSNQSTDAEQHFSGSRPSWQARVAEPQQQTTTTTTTTTDVDGYNSPTRPSLPKAPKRRHAQESSSGNDSDGGCSMDDGAMNEAVGKISKKQRLHWSAELHTRFMSAVHHLGIDTAVPKNILQLMNVEGMTRDNVASHLQKYRLHLKRLAGVGPNDPIPPHLVPQVQAEAMRLHKAKQQQEAFQMRMLQEHRSRQDRSRQASDSAATAPQHHHQPASPSTSSPSSPEAPPTRLFPPLVIDHESAAGQPPFHPFAQPAPSLHAARAHEGHSNGGGKKAAAAVHSSLHERGGGGGGGSMQGLMPTGSASMDAVQLGYTLGLMQGASQPWKTQQQYPSHMVGPSHPSLMHLPPHLQAQLFDPTAAAAAAMANSLQQQQQQQQQQQHQQHQQPTTSSGLSLASLAALQQMYCMQQPYGAAFMVQPNAASLMSQGDSMYGLQPNGMWPVRSVFPPGGPYHPPC